MMETVSIPETSVLRDYTAQRHGTLSTLGTTLVLSYRTEHVVAAAAVWSCVLEVPDQVRDFFHSLQGIPL
jgi:hypothetical protein